MVILSDQERLLLNHLFESVKIFLDENEEFAPFGVVLDKNNELIPIAIYPDEFSETIDSSNLIENFEKYINSIKDDEKYIGVALAIDVTISGSSVIWIRTDQRKAEAKDFYREYYKDDSGSHSFFDLILSDKSSLQIWN